MLHQGSPSPTWIWNTLHRQGPLVILSRTNHAILQILTTLHRCPEHPWENVGLRWLSTSMATQVRELLDKQPPPTLHSLQPREGDPPADPTVTRLVRLAQEVDGAGTSVADSGMLRFLDGCLSRPADASQCTISTVHSFKGLEADHVVLVDYNHFGCSRNDSETAQDNNLLYIGITRSTSALTLPTRRPKDVRRLVPGVPFHDPHPESPATGSHHPGDHPRWSRIVRCPDGRLRKSASLGIFLSETTTYHAVSLGVRLRSRN